MNTPLPEPGAPMGHYVSSAAFDPYAAERIAFGESGAFDEPCG